VRWKRLLVKSVVGKLEESGNVQFAGVQSIKYLGRTPNRVLAIARQYPSIRLSTR
jgi:hypothetical protein